MMKNVIYKYPINPVGRTELMLPIDNEILSLQVQRECPYLWVRLNPEQSLTRHAFEVKVTGGQFDPMGLKYIGTFQLKNGGFVGHLFKIEANLT